MNFRSTGYWSTSKPAILHSAAVAAWNAAAQRYRKPFLSTTRCSNTGSAPALARTSDSGGWMIAVSRRYPWPGKRDLRGSAGPSAEADAVCGDLGDARLKLAKMTRMAF